MQPWGRWGGASVLPLSWVSIRLHHRTSFVLTLLGAKQSHSLTLKSLKGQCGACLPPCAALPSPTEPYSLRPEARCCCGLRLALHSDVAGAGQGRVAVVAEVLGEVLPGTAAQAAVGRRWAGGGMVGGAPVRALAISSLLAPLASQTQRFYRRPASPRLAPPAALQPPSRSDPIPLLKAGTRSTMVKNRGPK